MENLVKLDERYLKILATYTPREIPRRYRRLAAIGIVAMMAGAVVFIGKGLLWGIAIAAAGLIVVGIASIKKSKHFTKTSQEYIDYYQKNGELPPYPEEK